jgi:hypothetical protein
VSDTTDLAPYTYTITLLSDGSTANSAPTWQVKGGYLTIQGEMHVISDMNGNVLAAVHTFGTLVTRNDAVAA